MKYGDDIGIGGVWILMPKGTVVKGYESATCNDTLECPAGSGRFYGVKWVENVAEGFPNEYVVAHCQRWNLCGGGGDGVMGGGDGDSGGGGGGGGGGAGGGSASPPTLNWNYGTIMAGLPAQNSKVMSITTTVAGWVFGSFGCVGHAGTPAPTVASALPGLAFTQNHLTVLATDSLFGWVTVPVPTPGTYTITFSLAALANTNWFISLYFFPFAYHRVTGVNNAATAGLPNFAGISTQPANKVNMWATFMSGYVPTTAPPAGWAIQLGTVSGAYLANNYNLVTSFLSNTFSWVPNGTMTGGSMAAWQMEAADIE